MHSQPVHRSFAAKKAAQDDNVVRGCVGDYAFAYFTHFKISGRFGRFP